jgi:hypothetical protein
VRREKRLTVSLEVFLVSGNHTIEPRKELLGTMIRVNENGDTISLGNGTNILSTRDSTEDGSFLVLVINSLTSNEGSTTVGELDDDRRTVLLGSFEGSIDGTMMIIIMMLILKFKTYIFLNKKYLKPSCFGTFLVPHV